MTQWYSWTYTEYFSFQDSYISIILEDVKVIKSAQISSSVLTSADIKLNTYFLNFSIIFITFPVCLHESI